MSLHKDKYSVENFDKYCLLYWSPSATEDDQKSIKEDLLAQRKGELVVEFKRVNNLLKLHEISSILQNEISITEFKTSMVAFYENIRNCTCQREDDNIFIFSEQKKIDITIKLFAESSKFSVCGSEDSLVRFLHAYCECINTILKKALFKTPHASQLASTNTLVPNKKIQEELDTKSVANLDLS